MAERKKKTASLGCLFWIAFILLVIVLFFLKRNTIATVLENTGAMDLLFGGKTTVAPSNSDPGASDAPLTGILPPASETGGKKPDARTDVPASGDGSAGDSKKDTPAPSASSPEATAAGPGSQAVPGAAQTKPSATAPAPTAPAATSTPAATANSTAGSVPAAQPPATRKATLFFVRIDADGAVVRTEVTREVPKTDSPMSEALRALLAGPASGDSPKGLRSLVPPGTRLLSASVKDGVALINLSEEFQFNQFGIEGYIGQLAQVVFTATAFPTVNSVQFLIDGQRREYLGAEGVWIGTPLSRDKF